VFLKELLILTVTEFSDLHSALRQSIKEGKGKDRALDIALQVDKACHQRGAQVYMARTKQKQRRTYLPRLPYTFPAIADTHLPTPRGWG